MKGEKVCGESFGKALATRPSAEGWRKKRKRRRLRRTGGTDKTRNSLCSGDRRRERGTKNVREVEEEKEVVAEVCVTGERDSIHR